MNNVANYDIEPEGERFIMTTEDEAGEASSKQINIVLNWFEELKERVPVP